MAYWNRQKIYSVDKPVVAFADGVATPHSVTLDAANFFPNYTEADNAGKKVYAGGHFICLTGGAYRFLPRSVVGSTAFATGNANGSVTLPYLYKVGDVLTTYDKTSASPTFTAVGTIQSINYETGAITLGANAANAAAASAGIAVNVPFADILGIHEHSLDFELRPIQNIAVISKASGVYEGSLPFIDAHLREYFRDRLNIRTKF